MRTLLVIFVLTIVALAAAKPSFRREKARASLVKQLRNLKAGSLNHHVRTVGKFNPFRRAEEAKQTALTPLSRMLKSGKLSQFKRNGGGSETEGECPDLPQDVADCIASEDDDDFTACYGEEFRGLVESIFDFYEDQTGEPIFSEDEQNLLTTGFDLSEDIPCFEDAFGHLVKHVSTDRFESDINWANVSEEDLATLFGKFCAIEALEEEMDSRFVEDKKK